MPESGPLADLIRKAHQRHLSQHLIAQMAFSIAVVLGFAILLLLLGTEILSPYWLIVVFCAALALGLYRTRKRLLSRYRLAQELDRRLSLNDSLSTATYFHDHPGQAHASPELVEDQRAVAEDQARSADLRTGLPFHPPRALYASSCLAAIAVSIFAVRYGVTRSLDLRPSLVHIAFTGSMDPEQIASAKKKAGQKTASDRVKESGVSYDPWESKVMDQQGAPESALNTVDTPDVNNTNADSGSDAKANGTASKDPVQEPGEAAENGERSPSGNDQPGDNVSAPDKDGGRSGKQGAPQDKQNQNSSVENSSLSDKMRDALANLLSKLKSSQKPGEGKQGASQSPNNAQSAQQRQGRDEKGSPTPGKPQADGMSSPDAQGEQEGQSSDKAQSAQNKSAQNSDKPSSQDGKSGIGKQDGDKSTHEAEQLAAMGKISQIIGKRSANMTGEVMVEVGSGKQQLKTQYSQKRAAHAEAGGEINRDEVPLAYQQYVQQYFEEIRKLPATAPKPKKPTGL